MARNNHDDGLHAKILQGRSICHANVNAVGIAEFQRLARKPDALGLIRIISESINTTYIADAGTPHGGENGRCLRTYLLLQVDSRHNIVAAHSSTGNQAFCARYQLQDLFIMRRYPARQQLRVGKFPAPEEIRSAVDKYWALLRERVPRRRVLNFDNQCGGMN